MKVAQPAMVALFEREPLAENRELNWEAAQPWLVALPLQVAELCFFAGLFLGAQSLCLRSQGEGY